MHLHEIAKSVKDGIRNAGGVPLNFTIGVGWFAMNHEGMIPLAQEIIADSIEIMLALTA